MIHRVDCEDPMNTMNTSFLQDSIKDDDQCKSFRYNKSKVLEDNMHIYKTGYTNDTKKVSQENKVMKRYWLLGYQI